MIQQLQEKAGLLDVIIGELLQYKASALEKAKTLGILPACSVSVRESSDRNGLSLAVPATLRSVSTGSQQPLSGGLTDTDDIMAEEANDAEEKRVHATTEKKISGTRNAYSIEIQSRLQFLSFVLTKSASTSLDMDTFDRLWQGLAVKYVTPGEKEAFFGWLLSTQFPSEQPGVDSRRLLSDAEATTVFASRMCDGKSMQFDRLTPTEFKCFDAFFVHCNAVAGKLSSKYASDVTVSTRNLELTGVDALWALLTTVRRSIALQCTEFYAVAQHAVPNR